VELTATCKLAGDNGAGTDDRGPRPEKCVAAKPASSAITATTPRAPESPPWSGNPQSHAPPSSARRRCTPANLAHSRGVEPLRGLNVIPADGREFLLTVTAGDAVHLSQETGPDQTARCAIPDWQLEPQQVDSRVRWRVYDQAALAEPRWAETACGDRHGPRARDRPRARRHPAAACAIVHLKSAFSSGRTGPSASPILPGQRHFLISNR